MSLWNRGLFDEALSKTDQAQQKKEPQGRLQQLSLWLIAVFVLLYPFTFVGFIPYVVIQGYFKGKDKQHVGELEYIPIIKRIFPISLLGSFILLFINASLFLGGIPNAYLSNYLLFPFNFIESNLHYNWLSFLVLLFGGAGQCFIMFAMTSFIAKRQIQSKEERLNEVKKSKEYQARKENKFEEVRKESRKFEHKKQIAYFSDDLDTSYKGKVFIGIDEFGKPVLIDFHEINQHAIVTGTTGGGKTTFVMNFVDYAIENHIPILYLDGKGAVDTLESVRTIAKKYKRDVKVFSDTENLRYNPIKHGNSVMIRDRLISLAETESVYYTTSAKSLLQSTVQLIDHYQVPRTLENVSEYTLPRNVLFLFLEELLIKKPDVLMVEVQQDKPKEKKKKAESKKKEVASTEKEDQTLSTGAETDQLILEALDKNEIEIDGLDVTDDLQENKLISSKESPSVVSVQEQDTSESVTELTKLEDTIEPVEQVRLEELNPNTMDLESFYYLIRRFKWLLSEQSQLLFKQLFTRYEHKDNPFYLYATSESLQTNINMLIDSELGKLFDTTEPGVEELDLLDDSKKGEIMFITLNGLVYKDYIKTLAQFFVSEINYLASEQYIYNEYMPFLLICDEPSVYLNDTFIDTVNKGRGAGLHTIFSPQTLSDIDRIEPILTEQLIGNCNSYYVGQTNLPKEMELWANVVGTYRDIELTTMTEQEQGYSDAGRSDWSGSRGTQRGVRNFVFHPDDLRDMRQGEFMMFRKSNNLREQARRIYANNPANRKQAYEKND